MYMNLKLIKVDYKKDREKENLNYDFFGEYMKKVDKKKIFKGGFGNTNLKMRKIPIPRKLNLIESLDHQYQINTIIKRFHDTIKKPSIEYRKIIRSRNTDSLSKSTLFRPINHISLNSPHNTIRELNQSNIVNRVFTPQNMLDLYKNYSTSSFHIASPVLPSEKGKLVPKGFLTSRNQRNKPNNTYLPLERHNLTKTKQSFHNPFIEYINGPYSQTNSIKKELKKECQFIRGNEDEFEKTKKKIFNDIEISKKFYPKHSIYYINLILRRNNSQDFLKKRIIK